MGATLRTGHGGGDLRTGGASLADPVWRPLGHKSPAAAAPEASALSRYRPEVDGLRALAVLPVILFHAGFAPFAGGFVGVDVFFVISGYLIAGLLAADLAAGRFSILRFYERRARRLLPALAVVILACLPFVLAWMPPEHLRAFAQSLAAVALLGLSAALVLAGLTWRFVETPFRVSGPGLARHRALLARQGALFSVAALCLAGLLGLGLALPRLQAWAFSPPRLPVIAERQDSDPCLITGWVPITGRAAARIAACRGSLAPGERVAFLVGDSHAMAVSAALRGALAAEGYRLISFAHPACYPIPGTSRRPEADAARRAGLEAQSLVVLSELAATRPVLLLGPFPEAGWDVPLVWAKQVRFGGETAPEIGIAAAIIAAAATGALPERLAGRIDLTGEDERQSERQSGSD